MTATTGGAGGIIGYRATASAFSREALAAGFGIRERDLPQFSFTPVDPLIVARPNPPTPRSSAPNRRPTPWR